MSLTSKSLVESLIEAVNYREYDLVIFEVSRDLINLRGLRELWLF